MKTFLIFVLLQFGLKHVRGASEPRNVTALLTIDPEMYNCTSHSCTTEESPICSYFENAGEGELVEDINRCYYNQRVRCTQQLYGNAATVTMVGNGLCVGTECIGAIPAIYAPVCSSIDNVPITHSNRYEFEMQRNCAQKFRKRTGVAPTVTFLHNDRCLNNENLCWRNCTTAQSPVCSAVDGNLVTDDNRCILNNKIRCNNMVQRPLDLDQISVMPVERTRVIVPKISIIRFLHNGRCRGDELECPPMACKRDYRPVCTSVNGTLKTMSNLCMFQRKKKCEDMLRRYGKKNVPRTRLRYRGRCGARRRTTRRRRRRSTTRRRNGNQRRRNQRRVRRGN